MTEPMFTPAAEPVDWNGWTVPPCHAPVSIGRCRSDDCRATIAWYTTPGGKVAPFDRDGVSHFATCPGAARFRARAARR